MHASAPAAVPAYIQAGVQETAPGAVPALVLGILSIVLPYIGWILGIIAIVQAKKAKRAIIANRNLQGQGMATAGKVMGIISLVLWLGVVGIIFFSAIVFVLVSGSGDGTAEMAIYGF